MDVEPQTQNAIAPVVGAIRIHLSGQCGSAAAIEVNLVYGSEGVIKAERGLPGPLGPSCRAFGFEHSISVVLERSKWLMPLTTSTLSIRHIVERAIGPVAEDDNLLPVDRPPSEVYPFRFDYFLFPGMRKKICCDDQTMVLADHFIFDIFQVSHDISACWYVD